MEKPAQRNAMQDSIVAIHPRAAFLLLPSTWSKADFSFAAEENLFSGEKVVHFLYILASRS
ncbi:hypothetical protein SDC9_193349 [bioreactor metagenome]|uniref:Uncharacterized protein n=1 Tax=bioreactor metagenome TaxID=1076179 RepID=A0A645I399_9ZZZZ